MLGKVIRQIGNLVTVVSNNTTDMYTSQERFHVGDVVSIENGVLTLHSSKVVPVSLAVPPVVGVGSAGSEGVPEIGTVSE